jgi:transcriptional regulator with XRE-family HTH domain
MKSIAIGETLKRLRKIRGQSQFGLAEKSGVGYASIARIETGRQDPTVGMLTRLAEALGVDVVDFFTLPGKAKRPARKRARGK